MSNWMQPITPEQLVVNAIRMKEICTGDRAIDEEELDSYARIVRLSCPYEAYFFTGNSDKSRLESYWEEFIEKYDGVIDIERGESYSLCEDIDPVILDTLSPIRTANEIDTFCSERASGYFSGELANFAARPIYSPVYTHEMKK